MQIVIRSISIRRRGYFFHLLFRLARRSSRVELFLFPFSAFLSSFSFLSFSLALTSGRSYCFHIANRFPRSPRNDHYSFLIRVRTMKGTDHVSLRLKEFRSVRLALAGVQGRSCRAREGGRSIRATTERRIGVRVVALPLVSSRERRRLATSSHLRRIQERSRIRSDGVESRLNKLTVASEDEADRRRKGDDDGEKGEKRGPATERDREKQRRVDEGEKTAEKGRQTDAERERESEKVKRDCEWERTRETERERGELREIARGASRLARTCLLGPPSFNPDRARGVPTSYLIRFLARCI